MNRSAVLAISALAGAIFMAIVASSNTGLAVLMGAGLGITAAIVVFAFPLDLDYRERRVWPPREP